VPFPFNDGFAGVCCPVAVLCVAAGFHAGTKLFNGGLMHTRAGWSTLIAGPAWARPAAARRLR
jgi:hypothetical protein